MKQNPFSGFLIFFKSNSMDLGGKDGAEESDTEGVIWKQLLIFFFPIVIGTFFQQVYNTADSIVVGRFVGKEALAAVSGISESDRYTDCGSFCRTDFGVLP